MLKQVLTSALTCKFTIKRLPIQTTLNFLERLFLAHLQTQILLNNNDMRNIKEETQSL